MRWPPSRAATLPLAEKNNSGSAGRVPLTTINGVSEKPKKALIYQTSAADPALWGRPVTLQPRQTWEAAMLSWSRGRKAEAGSDLRPAALPAELAQS